MKISELIAALHNAADEHGDLDVLVLDEELGEWRDTRAVSVETGVVWRDNAPMTTAVHIAADYDG
ncbi:hypothetical protein OVA21_04015 [Dietzia sp. SL131]|uniref:hypothetical protein n=1 Tax=Dietzia sp. SL131 TaxID=2995149 RepID=UPI00227A8947|nr:hypothetical protein [Dietzia sp. SL131]MCY1656387.1 hypothetical protein [Dietzia sp. SL131]